MRCSIPIVGFGIIASGVLLMAAHAQEGRATTAFTIYQSNQPQLPVRFEYPADWEVEHSSGTTEVYSQVQIYAPKSLEDRLRMYMVVRAIPPKAQGGRYAGLPEMIEDYQKTLLPSLRIEQDQQTAVLGSAARQLEISGTLRLPWKSPLAQPVPVKSQRIFLEKNGWLYELGWLATPEISYEVEEAFSHLLQTLTLIE